MYIPQNTLYIYYSSYIALSYISACGQQASLEKTLEVIALANGCGAAAFAQEVAQLALRKMTGDVGAVAATLITLAQSGRGRGGHVPSLFIKRCRCGHI